MGRKTNVGLTAALIVLLIAGVAVMIFILIYFRGPELGVYDAKHFGIEEYISAVDMDGDGIDDQTDILENARAYVSTSPQYQSVYYDGGWPTDSYGVCTDVVARALLGAGYDLRELVDADRAARPGDYADEKPDKNIDFRRVRNLIVYFRHTAIKLTTDVTEIAEWQAGDIVVWDGHIGVISDKRNHRGVPFVLHHANAYQKSYEEDILESAAFGEITGHFRIS